MPKKWTAEFLCSLLREKHAGDFFVRECKDGPTLYGRHRRLDAWVLRATWSPMTTIGYEVKVSRSDFEQDQKWLDYRPLVHQLALVCPPKLVTRADLPAGIGLIWPTVSGSKLITKVRAERGITWDPEVGRFHMGVVRQMDRLRGAVGQGLLTRIKRLGEDLIQTGRYIEGEIDKLTDGSEN